jgi:ABC-type branched-subunit amino acid transport system ATPase component
MSLLQSTPADFEVTGIVVRFGGLVAVDDVSLRGQAGVITGLIGPNGAGKTTTFNACTGLVKPTSGSVRLDGHTLNGRSPARRASLGLGRTFQRMALWDTLSVRDNIALGQEARLSALTAWGQLIPSRGQRSACLAAADDALEVCGISHLANAVAGELSTGQRRLAELARAIAASFRYLLLDEPSSGLDESETAAFGRVLLDVTTQRGTGILLVEHDMSLVRRICEYVYVLDFGRLVYQGTTTDVLSSDIVRAAYLGTVEVA